MAGYAMVEFHADADLRGAIPEPQPASHFLPDWYRRKEVRFEPGDVRSGTVKRCVPVRDAMTAGYVIPMWADVEITPAGDDVSWRSEFVRDTIATHSYVQVSGCPLAEREPYGRFPMKFVNPWIVRTPPGYSCLFQAPIGHFEDRFYVLEGVVDTDVYYNQVNFPFVWTTNESGIVERGTPLVQVIPFKRLDWEASVSYGTTDRVKNDRAVAMLKTRMQRAYQSLFWVPKRFTRRK